MQWHLEPCLHCLCGSLLISFYTVAVCNIVTAAIVVKAPVAAVVAAAVVAAATAVAASVGAAAVQVVAAGGGAPSLDDMIMNSIGVQGGQATSDSLLPQLGTPHTCMLQAAA